MNAVLAAASLLSSADTKPWLSILQGMGYCLYRYKAPTDQAHPHLPTVCMLCNLHRITESVIRHGFVVGRWGSQRSASANTALGLLMNLENNDVGIRQALQRSTEDCSVYGTRREENSTVHNRSSSNGTAVVKYAV